MLERHSTQNRCCGRKMNVPTRRRWKDRIHRSSSESGIPLCGAKRRGRDYAELPLNISDEDDAVTCDRCRKRLSVVELMRLNNSKR
jgi:hypothetical protein